MAPDPPWAWRFAVPEDAPAIVPLVRAAYRGGTGWTSEEHLVEGLRIDSAALRELIAGTRALMLVVSDSASLIACCSLENGGSGVARLGMFAVLPERQDEGLGRWLIGEAERVAAGRLRAHTVEISVLVQQTALLAWYERLGFVRTGQSKPFPAHPRFARPLRDDLEFAVLRKSIG